MTFEEYINEVRWRAAYRGERQGQAYFNVLHEYRPDLAGRLPEGLDPFYNDEYIPAFLVWVGSNWQ